MLYFTCLSSNLTGSSVWAQSKDVRILWASMLSMADPDGVVCENIMGIANRSYLTLEETTVAMEVLTSPDPYSSTTAHEGRRVIKNGNAEWVIVNHTRYQEMFMEQHRREKNRKRMQRVREERKPTRDSEPPEICAQSVQGCVPSNSNSNSNSNLRPPFSPKKTPEKNWGIPPEDWKPMVEHMKLATKRGLDAELTAEQFRVYQQPGKVPLDWNIAFKHYVLTRFVPAKAGGQAAVRGPYEPSTPKRGTPYKPGMR